MWCLCFWHRAHTWTTSDLGIFSWSSQRGRSKPSLYFCVCLWSGPSTWPLHKFITGLLPHLAPLLLRSLQEGACTMNAMGLLPCHKLYIYPSDDISPLWSDSSLMAMVVNGSLSPQVLRNIEDFTRQIWGTQVLAKEAAFLISPRD